MLRNAPEVCTSLRVSISVQQASFCPVVISDGASKMHNDGHTLCGMEEGLGLPFPDLPLGRGLHLAEWLNMVFGDGVIRRDRRVGKRVSTPS